MGVSQKLKKKMIFILGLNILIIQAYVLNPIEIRGEPRTGLPAQAHGSPQYSDYPDYQKSAEIDYLDSIISDLITEVMTKKNIHTFNKNGELEFSQDDYNNIFKDMRLDTRFV